MFCKIIFYWHLLTRLQPSNIYSTNYWVENVLKVGVSIFNLYLKTFECRVQELIWSFNGMTLSKATFWNTIAWSATSETFSNYSYLVKTTRNQGTLFSYFMAKMSNSQRILLFCKSMISEVIFPNIYGPDCNHWILIQQLVSAKICWKFGHSFPIFIWKITRELKWSLFWKTFPKEIFWNTIVLSAIS